MTDRRGFEAHPFMSMNTPLRCQGWVVTCLLAGYVLCYLAAGVYTESRLGAALMQDFMHYQSAFFRFEAGESPYAERHVGLGFLYPPAALFVAEVFSIIRPFDLMAAVYILFNIALITAMVYGLARHYGFRWRQVWWWYPLCLGFAPLLETLHLGQINVITLFGVFLLFVGAARSYTLSGAGLCLAVLTKVSPLLFFAYLGFNRYFKTAIAAVIAIVAVSALAAMRYGLEYTIEYAEVFRGMTEVFPRIFHSHSMAANLQRLNEWLPGILAVEAAVREPALAQRLLAVYVLVLILISGVLTWISAKQDESAAPREPLFIIIALGMAVSPNILWYHHWVFVLLPLLLWMAWARLNPWAVSWCLFGLLLMQYDRWHPPHGLLIHIYCHLSLWLVLAWQIRAWRDTARGRGVADRVDKPAPPPYASLKSG